MLVRMRLVGTVVAAMLLVAGCGAEEGPTATPESTVTDPVAEVALPDHDAGRAAAWVLELVAPDHDGRLTDDDVDRFTTTFLEAIPLAELEVVLAQVRAAGPWTPTAVEGGEVELVVRITAAETELQMVVTVDDDGRIAGLWFGEPPAERAGATSWDGLLDEVNGLAGQVSLFVARVDDGACTPVDGLPNGSAAGEPLPIGSMVKLYVLAAVVSAIADGELAWTDEVTVTDAMRSLPSGRLQDEPDGTTVSVREAAELMISISDNTATDLLIAEVGRDRVEQAFTELGMADPGPNVPLMTTRELFHLGWGGGPELREEWARADEEQRRALLAAVPDGPPTVDVRALLADPVWEHGLDWFATGADLCAAHVGLQQLARTSAGGPVPEILALNPGVRVDEERWSSVAFKGGSAPGTMGGAWYAVDTDGAATVVVLQAAAPDAAGVVDGVTMVGIVQDVFRLLP